MRMRNIVLVGFMGTGKTTTGRIIARRLGMDFADMDRILEERENKSISDIFDKNGEPYFRSLERGLVKELSKKTGMVIAAGGGVVLDSENIADYSGSGLVVCLKASSKVILDRVSSEKHRPLLESRDKSEKILEILESRKSLYNAISCSVDTTNLTPADVVEKVICCARKKGVI